MDLTFSLLRPDDLVALTVEATNMRMDTSDRQARGWYGTRQPAGDADVPVPAAGDRRNGLLRGPAGSDKTVNPPPFNPPAGVPPVPMPTTGTESPSFPAPSTSG